MRIAWRAGICRGAVRRGTFARVERWWSGPCHRGVEGVIGTSFDAARSRVRPFARERGCALPAFSVTTLAEDRNESIGVLGFPRLDVDSDVRLTAIQARRERSCGMAGRLAGANDPIHTRHSGSRTDLVWDRIARKDRPRDRNVGPAELCRTCVRRRADHLEAIARTARSTRRDDIPRTLAGRLSFAGPSAATGSRNVRGAGGLDPSVTASEEPVGAVGAGEIQTACFSLRGHATRALGWLAPNTPFTQPSREASAFAAGHEHDQQQQAPEALEPARAGHVGERTRGRSSSLGEE